MKMIQKIAICVLTAAVSQCVWPQDIWRTPDGVRVPDSPTRKSKNGLGASLLITPDPDWKSKWNTPSSEVPHFSESKNVRIGGTLNILTFVANPKPGSGNTLNVISHIRIIRPDGTTSIDAPNQPCLHGPMNGPSTNTRLCEAVVGFKGDPGDPIGEWQVHIAITDLNRATTIALDTSFNLQDK